MKLKHNKKKNTAFLYEACLRTLAKAIQEKDEDTKKKIVSLIKEGFSLKTLLGQDLRLHQEIYIPKTKSPDTISKIIEENKRVFFSLSQDKLNEERNNFAKKMLDVSPEIFDAFVPNFKLIASVNQLFSPVVSASDKFALQENIIRELTETKEKPKLKLEHLDNLAYKLFIKTFNEKYSSLLKEQKELISRFVMSLTGESLPFKIYINEEIGRLRSGLKEASKTKDPVIVEKVEELQKFLGNFSQNFILENKSVVHLLKIQELLKILKEEEN